MSVEDSNGIVGKRESHILEFKAKEILKTPAKIARGVVAFLNSKGGNFWIGYPEQNGVAGAPELVPDADRALGSLRNHLIDTIEPPVQIPGEIDLKAVNGQILVSVKPGMNGPYAHRDGGRRFWIRVADRVREMSREEIAKTFRNQPGPEGRLGKVVTDLRKGQLAAEKPSLWLRLVPSERLSIDLDDEAAKRQFREWLMDVSTTGNRRTGWNFANNLSEPKFLGNLVSHGMDPYRQLEIRNDGQVTFTLTLHNLYHKGNDNDPRDLYPYALMEFPVSVFRLAAAILGRYDAGRSNLQVVAGFVISGIRGWRLRPGSPEIPALPWAGPKSFDQNVLEIDPEQLVFDADKLKENPDRCGLKLVRLIYGAFGFESSQIPPEFDQQHGVLRLG